METIIAGPVSNKNKLYGRALALALITIIYNVAEGLVSVFFGVKDDTIALFGFGLDSFVEVISGIGILHMVTRLRKHGNSNPDRFEQRALRVTGTAFYILTAGLIVTAGINLYKGHTPDTTIWGIIIASISIVTMWLLIHYKVKVGNLLDSDAIIADANCTKACLYLSIILLVSSIGYELTGIGGIDSIGAIGIAWFAFKEGRESFEKAQGRSCSCSGNCET
jgi:divalent metal cation (Fe/Co/Zn/Cd) transporter